MVERSARCSCGQLRAQCEGEPVRVSVCHCLACKRRTGSAFAHNASFPKDRVRTSGQAASYSRLTDTGRTNRYHFCPVCGSTVFYDVELRPGTLSVPAGAFADEAFPPPTVQVFTARKVAWCELDIADD